MNEAIKLNTSHEDSDYRVQCSIIFALGDIGDNQATEPLVRLMLENGEIRIRGTAGSVYRNDVSLRCQNCGQQMMVSVAL